MIEKLPIAEVRETLLTREIWFDGKMINRKYFYELFYEYLSSNLNRLKMNMKVYIARYLLRGVADPCPYCNKLIDQSKWTKLFDE